MQAPEIFDKRIFGLADVKGIGKIIPAMGRGRGRSVMPARTLAEGITFTTCFSERRTVWLFGV